MVMLLRENKMPISGILFSRNYTNQISENLKSLAKSGVPNLPLIKINHSSSSNT
jgi:hypothetical protein